MSMTSISLRTKYTAGRRYISVHRVEFERVVTVFEA